jgi:hypothetical protein
VLVKNIQKPFCEDMAKVKEFFRDPAQRLEYVRKRQEEQIVRGTINEEEEEELEEEERLEWSI